MTDSKGNQGSNGKADTLGKERRAYARFDVPLQVRFKEVKEGAYSYSGITLNFSRSGICLKTPDGAETLRGALELQVKMPEKDEYIPALGDVVWVDDSGSQCLFGIKLIAMDRVAKFNILDYCHKQNKIKSKTGLSLN